RIHGATQRAGQGPRNRTCRHRGAAGAVGRGLLPGPPRRTAGAPSAGCREAAGPAIIPQLSRARARKPPTPGVTGEYTPAANTRAGVSLASPEPRLQHVFWRGIWTRRQRGGPTPEPFAQAAHAGSPASRPTLSGGRVPHQESPAMPQITMRQMLEAGVHFGHQTRYWNPKMSPYIFGARGKIHIITLAKTMPLFGDAMNFISGIAQKRGMILFVGTKRSARDAIKEEAERCGMPYMTQRWLGGTLTNFRTVKGSVS